MNDQRLHDLKTVQADFRAVFNLIKAGYRFDDAEAHAVIDQLEKALKLLKQEIQNLEREDSH